MRSPVIAFGFATLVAHAIPLTDQDNQSNPCLAVDMSSTNGCLQESYQPNSESPSHGQPGHPFHESGQCPDNNLVARAQAIQPQPVLPSILQSITSYAPIPSQSHKVQVGLGAFEDLDDLKPTGGKAIAQQKLKVDETLVHAAEAARVTANVGDVRLPRSTVSMSQPTQAQPFIFKGSGQGTLSIESVAQASVSVGASIGIQRGGPNSKVVSSSAPAPTVSKSTGGLKIMLDSILGGTFSRVKGTDATIKANVDANAQVKQNANKVRALLSGNASPVVAQVQHDTSHPQISASAHVEAHLGAVVHASIPHLFKGEPHNETHQSNTTAHVDVNVNTTLLAHESLSSNGTHAGNNTTQSHAAEDLRLNVTAQADLNATVIVAQAISAALGSDSRVNVTTYRKYINGVDLEKMAASYAAAAELMKSMHSSDTTKQSQTATVPHTDQKIHAIEAKVHASVAPASAKSAEHRADTIVVTADAKVDQVAQAIAKGKTYPAIAKIDTAAANKASHVLAGKPPIKSTLSKDIQHDSAAAQQATHELAAEIAKMDLDGTDSETSQIISPVTTTFKPRSEHGADMHYTNKIIVFMENHRDNPIVQNYIKLLGDHGIDMGEFLHYCYTAHSTEIAAQRAQIQRDVEAAVYRQYKADFKAELHARGKETDFVGKWVEAQGNVVYTVDQDNRCPSGFEMDDMVGCVRQRILDTVE